MVSLLNDKRVAAGKKPMGFINPFLYANPDCFQDIVRPPPRERSYMKCVQSKRFLAMKFTTRIFNTTSKDYAGSEDRCQNFF